MMSRAFTSEEYEAPEVVIEVPEKREPSADMELVFAYSKGRNLSDPSLPYEIGMHFLEGSDGFFQSDEFAVKWLDNAVKEGSVDAMMALADFYLKDTKTYGYRKPAELLSKAADRGNDDAMSRLDMVNIGDPTSRETFNAYRFNAELGNTDAMKLLAEGFEKGYFGKGKDKAAKLWYVRAFKNGDRDSAKRVLALYYKKRIELTEEELRFLRS